MLISKEIIMGTAIVYAAGCLIPALSKGVEFKYRVMFLAGAMGVLKIVSTL